MVHGIYRPWMRAPRPMVMNKTVIVNQQSHCHGRSGGFWGGLLGGFLGGGLFNSGLFGNIFGFGSGMTGMYGGGMMPGMMPGATNNYSYLNQLPGNTPANQTNTDVSILQKHFSDYIISERDGEFIATDKQGHTITGKSFEEMLEKLGGSTPASENPEAQNMNEMKQAAIRQGQLMKANTEAEKFMKNEDVIASGATISVIKDGENFAQYELTLKDGTKKIVQDITAAYQELGINIDGNDETDAPEDTTVTPGSNNPSDNVEDDPDAENTPPQGNLGTNSTNSGDKKWNVAASPGWMSKDAWLTAADGTTVYEIECNDGDRLNYGKNKIQSDGETITTGYKDIRSIVDRKTGKWLPVEVEEDTGRIKVKIDGNTTVYLEDFLSNDYSDKLKEKPKPTPMDIPINAYASTQPFK